MVVAYFNSSFIEGRFDMMEWRGTTILSVRKDNQVVVAGDGQVTMGNSVVKANATKVRILSTGNVLVGFAGATADAFTLRERLEEKLFMNARI